MLKKIRIDFGNGNVYIFTRDGRKRVSIGYYEAAVNCDVEFADGSKHRGIGIFDESSSGEHCGMMVFTDDDVVDLQNDSPTKVGKTPEQIWPYRYKLRAPLHCEDIHVGDDGWSS